MEELSKFGNRSSLHVWRKIGGCMWLRSMSAFKRGRFQMLETDVFKYTLYKHIFDTDEDQKGAGNF